MYLLSYTARERRMSAMVTRISLLLRSEEDLIWIAIIIKVFSSRARGLQAIEERSVLVVDIRGVFATSMKCEE